MVSIGTPKTIRKETGCRWVYAYQDGGTMRLLWTWVWSTAIWLSRATYQWVATVTLPDWQERVIEPAVASFAEEEIRDGNIPNDEKGLQFIRYEFTNRVLRNPRQSLTWCSGTGTENDPYIPMGSVVIQDKHYKFQISGKPIA